MSATNSTANINLPLFIGTDKPSWLVDWNGAMNAIDGAIASLQAAESSTSTALASLAQSLEALSGTVGQHTTALQTLTTAVSANTGNINTINSLIGNGTPTTTDQTIIGAINELNDGKAQADEVEEKISLIATSTTGDWGTQVASLASAFTALSDAKKKRAIIMTATGGVYHVSDISNAVFTKNQVVSDAVRADTADLKNGKWYRFVGNISGNTITDSSSTSLTDNSLSLYA